MHHSPRWLGFSPCHQSSSPGVICQCPEDWLRTGGRGQDLRSSPLATLIPTPEKPRRHTVDGTTSTRLRTHVSGETPSECVASPSVTGRGFATVRGDRPGYRRRCKPIRVSGWPGRRALRPLDHPRLHPTRTSGSDLPGAELGRCNEHLNQELHACGSARGCRPNPWRTREPLVASRSVTLSSATVRRVKIFRALPTVSGDSTRLIAPLAELADVAHLNLACSGPPLHTVVGVPPMGRDCQAW